MATSDAKDDLLRRLLAKASPDLQAMRWVAHGHDPRTPLECLYATMFKDDPKEFSRQYHQAEKDYRAEATRTITQPPEAQPGVEGGQVGLLPDESSEKLEEYIEKLLKEAAEG